mgnify:CR=1 FL=1|jgi:integrase
MVLTRKQIFQILCNADLKLKTAILLTSSGGLRISELTQLRYSDINFKSKPTKILIRTISKNKKPHEVFITEEATIQLQEYLKKHFGWHKNSLNLDLSGTYLFGRTSKIKNGDILRFNSNSAKQSMHILLQNHIKNIPKLSVKNENGRNVIHFHEFRKYFRTVVSNVCGIDYAKALMGYTSYMDTYYQLSNENKQQNYLSAEPHLTISEFQKVEKRYLGLSEKHEQLEKTISKLKEYLVTNNISIPKIFAD